MVRCNLASPKGKAMITLSLRGSVATAAIPTIGVRVHIYSHSEPLAKSLGRVAPLLSLRDIFPVSSGTFTLQGKA